MHLTKRQIRKLSHLRGSKRKRRYLQVQRRKSKEIRETVQALGVDISETDRHGTMGQSAIFQAFDHWRKRGKIKGCRTTLKHSSLDRKGIDIMLTLLSGCEILIQVMTVHNEVKMERCRGEDIIPIYISLYKTRDLLKSEEELKEEARAITRGIIESFK